MAAAHLEHARRLLHASGALDLHVDPIILQRLVGYDVTRKHEPWCFGQPLWNHTDVPRMLEAGYAGVILGVHYWPRESEAGWRELQAQVAYLDSFAEADMRCIRVREPADWYRAKLQGKLAVAPGIEGLYMINGRLERLEELSRMGVPVITLAHFGANKAVSSSVSPEPLASSGVTGFGRECIAEMNRLGIVVDIAHVNRRGRLEACELSTAPVICSHENPMGVFPHPRSLSDEELDAIAETGGLIGVLFGPWFLSGKTWDSSACVVDAITYIAERVGVEHVAIGSDFDGWMPSIPTDMRDCRDMDVVVAGLLERGFSDRDIGLILGENARRILGW